VAKWTFFLSNSKWLFLFIWCNTIASTWVVYKAWFFFCVYKFYWCTNLLPSHQVEANPCLLSFYLHVSWGYPIW
jgi:hypothetical protein